jgi:hypothetical protein
MSEYGRSLPVDDAPDPDAFRVKRCEPAAVRALAAPTDELVNGETVVGAFAAIGPVQIAGFSLLTFYVTIPYPSRGRNH